MKKLLPLVFAAVVLAGCQTAPVASVPQPGDLLAQVTQRDERIVAYFDEEFETVKAPVAKGYYRKLYGKTANGHYVAQDFYQDTKTKQVDPFRIIDEKGLPMGDNDYVDGPITWYDPQGVKTQKRTFANGKVTGVEEDYYPNGKLKATTETRSNGVEVSQAFYEDGSKWLWMEKNPATDKEQLKAWHPNGQQALEFVDEKEGIKGWDAQGKKLSEEESARLLLRFVMQAG